MLFALQFTKFLGLNSYIDTLIKDIKRNPFEGIGKPKPLKHALSGYWSRRINDEHRIVYIACADFIKTVSETFLKHFIRNVNYLTLSHASLALSLKSFKQPLVRFFGGKICSMLQFAYGIAGQYACI